MTIAATRFLGSSNHSRDARTREDSTVALRLVVAVLCWITICPLHGYAERTIPVQTEDPRKHTHAEYLLNGQKAVVTLEDAANLREALRSQLNRQADDPWIKSLDMQKLDPGEAAIDRNGTVSMGPWRLFAELNELRLAMQYWISTEGFYWVRTVVTRDAEGGWRTGPLKNRDPKEPTQMEYRLGRKKIIVTLEDANQMYQALSAQLKQQADDPELKEF